MKKIIKITIIFLITIFSFYYTDKVTNFIKDKDPIMKRIKGNETINETINGVLTNDTILVGSSGKQINIDKSYEKMKTVKSYNEQLLEYIDIKPEINKKSNLDKLIIGKNTKNKEISFIFLIDDIDKFNEIMYILDKNSINATFFIKNDILKNYLNNIKSNINNNTIGFSNDEDNFLYNKSLIKKNFKNNYSNYCIYEDTTFLNTCIINKINTIKPIIVKNNLFNYLKINKNNGYIYGIDTTNNNIKELNTTIIYLKQKGYTFFDINHLLKE